MTRVFSISFVLCSVFAAISAGLSAASAQDYPSRAVSVIVPYPPGGRTDLAGRTLAQFLKDELKVPINVINKPGASGVLGAKELASAAPDGYTIGVFSAGFLMSLHTVPTPPTLVDYQLVALFNLDPAVIAVNGERGWKDLHALVQYGLANPGKLRVGINAGSSAHVFAAAFMTTAKIDAVYVPFRGGSERTAALGGGHIDVDFDIIAPMRPLMAAKKISVLGVASDKRVPDYADIPTMSEAGLPVAISSWHGVFVPRATPAPVVKALSSAIANVCSNPQFNAKMRDLLLGVRHLDRDAFQSFFTEQNEQMLALIKTLGLYVEANTPR
jgi:tripartite-type tricarboxylate transporter receptor subunit TctC